MMRRPDGQEIEVWQYQYPPEEIELHRAAVHDRKTISPSSISWVCKER